MSMSDWDIIEQSTIIVLACLFLLFLLSGRGDD